MTQIDFPLHVDSRGRTAETMREQHVRNLIEQVLFTSPGERVNRPDFGSGLMQMVFAPGSAELATATQFLVQGALQQWLGELIEVEAVEVSLLEATLAVTVTYKLRRTQQRDVAQFRRDVA